MCEYDRTFHILATARQFLNSGGVNNAIACPGDFSCTPYFPGDVPSTHLRFAFIQKAREISGPMIQDPGCSFGWFCPDNPITRGQISFFLAYGILGQQGIAPQQYYEGGSGSYLPAVTGVNCSSWTQLWNTVTLADRQDYYALSSTPVFPGDPTLWTVKVSSTLQKDGATLFGPPAQPVENDTHAALGYPSSNSNGQLVPGKYLQTATHTVLSGPCSVSLNQVTYSFPGDGTAQYLPVTITSVSPASATIGATVAITVTGHGLGGSLTGIAIGGAGVLPLVSTTSASNTQLTGTVTVPSNAALGTQSVYAFNANGGGFTENSNTLPFAIVPALVNPQLTSPATGTVLTSSPVTFVWNSVPGAQDYWIDVGTSPSSGNISGGYTGGVTQATVNLSSYLTGQTVYVQLYSKFPNINLVAGTGSRFQFATASLRTFTITTSPAGRSLTVDNVGCTAPCTFQWTPGTSHTVATSNPQAGGTGTQYVFASWSDGGGISHLITAPSLASIYTASFVTQYFLTTAVSPVAGGSISPANGWYNSGAQASINATPNSGYTFSGFTGSIGGTAKPQYLNMFGPQNVTATFALAPNFMISVVPPSQSVGPTGAAGFAITLSATGLTGTVAFSASGLPSGASASFNPPTLTGPGTTSLTIVTGANSPGGTFPVTINAVNSTLSRATTAFLTVTASSPANMISPAQGAVLTSSAATFVWDSGSGASQYQLALGSTPGASDYYSANTGTARSATANIPSSSQTQTFYATLGSMISGVWQTRSTSYRTSSTSTIAPPVDDQQTARRSLCVQQ
jgi:hypothetical protein